ncbi:MAG: sugar phosphate isomerase/epimerase [Gemmataceae bacterium]|nr:sugar phosphate isomerase/epimerase [Gemmataceae bacterium]
MEPDMVHSRIDRRGFLGLAAAAAFAGRLRAEDGPRFKISLAQWSLHNGFYGRGVPKLDPLDFAAMAKKDYGITGIEYVNSFYKELIKKPGLDKDLKKRADDNGVTSVLIMCDGEGDLGNPNDAARLKAVDNHVKWLELAKALGCHSIRVNAASDKKLPREEQARLAADGLHKLCDKADTFSLNVIVENHGGLSSHGDWLVDVMKRADHKRVGTLPDFGNFYEYDRYKGVEEMMPWAKGVSAKSHEFDEAGNETKTDYARMMKIVLDAGYRGWVGIEYEGKKLSEPEGIRATQRLLEKFRGTGK